MQLRSGDRRQVGENGGSAGIIWAEDDRRPQNAGWSLVGSTPGADAFVTFLQHSSIDTLLMSDRMFSFPPLLPCLLIFLPF